MFRSWLAFHVRFKKTDYPAERWPSGLRRTLGKRVYFNEYRGFESHSLRQDTSKSNYICNFQKRKPSKIREYHADRHE